MLVSSLRLRPLWPFLGADVFLLVFLEEWRLLSLRGSESSALRTKEGELLILLGTKNYMYQGHDFHFLLQNPRTREGFLKGFWRVSEAVCLLRSPRTPEGFLKGFWRVCEGVCLLQNPRTPEGFLKGSVCYRAPGPQKGFWRGLWRGLWMVFEGSSYLSAERPFKTPSKRLQEPFEYLSRRRRNRWCVRLARALKG